MVGAENRGQAVGGKSALLMMVNLDIPFTITCFAEK